MSYVRPNFKTKKALKDAVKNGDHVEVFEPGIGQVPRDGTIYIEGPHYPQPHTWYAEGTMRDGKLVRVR